MSASSWMLMSEVNDRTTEGARVAGLGTSEARRLRERA